MIGRIWHGTTNIERANEYLEYLNRTGIPDYQRTKGNLGAHVLQRIEDGVAHFFTVTFWDSYDAIKRFAGRDFERARYYPEDEKFLLAMEPCVEHFEVPETTPAYVRKYVSTRTLPRWW
jgi:heme-degrading monooxygenase HmoA